MENHAEDTDRVRRGNRGSVAVAPSPRARAAARRRDVLWAALLALAAGLLSLVGVLNGPQLSVLDEQTHLDYAWKLSRGDMPYIGVSLSDFSLQELSCRSQETTADYLPSCEVAESGTVGPADYPSRGENYNAWHPPLYYATAALTGSAAEAAGQSFTTGARLGGGLWLAAAAVAFFSLLRHWTVAPGIAASAVLVLVSVPSVAHSASSVTNDAPAALIGVGALWILTRVFRDGRIGWFAWVVPTLITLLAAGTKLMNSLGPLTAVGVVSLTALPYLAHGRWSEGVRRALVAVAPVAAVLTLAVAWTAYQDARTVPGWTSPISGLSTAPVEGGPFDEWAPTLFSAFGLVHDAYVPPTLTSDLIVVLIGLLGVLLSAAPFLAVTVFRAERPERMIGWAALFGAAALPLLVQSQEYLRNGDYFHGVTTRYGATLLPMTIAALALVADDRRFHVAAWLVAATSYLVMMLSFLGVV